jgi:hypothetical protein
MVNNIVRLTLQPEKKTPREPVRIGEANTPRDADVTRVPHKARRSDITRPPVRVQEAETTSGVDDRRGAPPHLPGTSGYSADFSCQQVIVGIVFGIS